MCSGALIGPNHVLTTASCVRKFENHENHTGFSYEGLTVSILGDADGSGSGSASGSGDDFHIHLIHVHPSAAFDMEVVRGTGSHIISINGVGVVCVRERERDREDCVGVPCGAGTCLGTLLPEGACQ